MHGRHVQRSARRGRTRGLPAPGKRQPATRPRLTGWLPAVCAAAVTVAAGLTVGLQGSTQASTASSFTAGTVSVGPGSPASVTCAATGLLPGMSSQGASIGSRSLGACTFNVAYTGTGTAWLGVDVSVAGGPALFASGSATGLQLYLADASSTTYVNSTATDNGGTGDTSYTQEGGAAAALPASGIADLLVSTTPAVTGSVVSLSLDYALPQDSANVFQSGTVTIKLTFHAVQSSGNALPADCAAGQQCNGGGDGSPFAWS